MFSVCAGTIEKPERKTETFRQAGFRGLCQFCGHLVDEQGDPHVPWEPGVCPKCGREGCRSCVEWGVQLVWPRDPETNEGNTGCCPKCDVIE